MVASRGIALVRPVGARLADALVTHVERRPIDLALARRQHAAYVELLEGSGWRVQWLPDLPDHPDGVFVEDTAVVVPGLAVLTRPGAQSRRDEPDSVAATLQAIVGRVARVAAPACLDGGDVLTHASVVYVGRSTRTNPAGIQALSEYLEPVGYRVVGVDVSGALHLKSASAMLPDGTLLHTAAVDSAAFDCEAAVVAPDASGANVLLTGGTGVVVAASAPGTAEMLAGRGFEVETVDISEFEKAEAGLTCLSILVPATTG